VAGATSGAGTTSGAGATAAEGRAEGAKDCEVALGVAADSGSWGSRVSPRSSETGGTAAEGAGAEDVGMGATAGSGELRAAGA